MKKEQIKKFWNEHKEEIIGGTLVLVSCVIIGVSVGSAVKASKRQLKRTTEAKIEYKNFCNEMVALGAEMTPGNPYPVATKEVAMKVLDEGEKYVLDGMTKGRRCIYVFDAKAVEEVCTRS